MYHCVCSYATMYAEHVRIHRTGLTRREQLILCLAVSPLKPRSVAAVRSLAVAGGLSAAKQWNVSALLGELKGLAVRTPKGWELSTDGRAAVTRLLGGQTTPVAASTLRSHLATIKSPDVQSFVEEAIGSIDSRHFRAAIVLSWVGALAVLYDHVVANHLPAFNTEALRRDVKWKAAKTTDDLTRLKEFDFLQVLAAISVIGKNVKTELEGCLTLRNGAGHPNSLRIAEHRVNSHVETLVLNVFARF